MLRAYFLLFLSVTLLNFNTSAQNKLREHKVKSAVGVAVGGVNSSLMEVKQMALNNAKIEALKNAGIVEHINAYSDYFRSESDNKMEELFTSDVLSNIRGFVKNINELDFQQEFTPEKQIKVRLTISCTVVEYESPKDLEFDIWVTGIRPNYKVGDSLNFSIQPTKDCYVKAFIFTPSEAFQLFPNVVEMSQLFKAMQVSEFPVSAGKYELDAGGGAKELNRLVLVFMKRNIPYASEVAYEKITEWIMSIPPDERVIKPFSFDVYQDVD